jgi:chromosome segregation ATPase
MSSPEKENESQINQNSNMNNNNNKEQGIYTLNSLSEEFNTLEKKDLPLKVDELKNNLENIDNNNEYINNYVNDLKEYYTLHLNNSFQNFRKCLNKLEELIKKSGNNKITAGMLKEIIDDTIFYEREKQIMNFIKEIKETQAQKEKIKNELKQNEINNITKKLENELNKKKNYKKISRELTVTLDKKNSEINELNKKITILEQEKNESSKLVQKKREELQNLKNDYTKIENEKIELEIKYNNLLEENKSLEKINQNYENNKKMLYQGIEQEKKKLIENIIKEINMKWAQKLEEKIFEIKNIKKSINIIKNEYKNKYDEFISSYKNNIILIQKNILQYDNQYKEKIKQIEKKYEKHLNEQILINDKLKRQNEELFNKKNEDTIDSKKMVFKISELENEINNQKAVIKKLKNDLDVKNKENNAINEKNLLIVKNLNNFLLMITKLKKKYLSIIFTLKTQINNLKDLYVSDISRMMTLNSNTNNNINILNNKLVQLQQENDELREINEKIQIKLNQLIEENEQKNNSINQLNEELLIRQQKINNLHNVFNKSISSYSNGIKNIQIAQKLDNDVQELIEKAKNQMSTISNYNTDNL